MSIRNCHLARPTASNNSLFLTAQAYSSWDSFLVARTDINFKKIVALHDKREWVNGSSEQWCFQFLFSLQLPHCCWGLGINNLIPDECARRGVSARGFSLSAVTAQDTDTHTHTILRRKRTRDGTVVKLLRSFIRNMLHNTGTLQS